MFVFDKEKLSKAIDLMTFELSTEGRKERRRRRMKPYNELKEVKRRKNALQRKKEPRYCALHIRVSASEYEKLQKESISQNISMAEYVRRKTFI